MSVEDCVAYFVKQDLSGQEITELIKKPVVIYSDLGKYRSLSQLLGKEKYVVILYQTSSYSTGHFVAITQGDNGKVTYFDSYGIPNPDTELQFTPYDKPLPKYLTKLLEGVDYESNTVDYQSKKSGISTCGRYASIACLWRNLSLLQIRELLKNNKSAYLQDTDNLVCLLTMLALSDIRDYLKTLPRSSGTR
jgi:hypothetical protein